MTEEQVKMFEGLRDGGMGRILSDYLSELIGKLCDIRLNPNMTPEYAKAVLVLSGLMQKEVIDRLRPGNSLEPPEVDSYE